MGVTGSGAGRARGTADTREAGTGLAPRRPTPGSTRPWPPTTTAEAPRMISHVVLFRTHRDLPGHERDGLLTAFERAVRDIPTVRGVRAGRRVLFGAGYEHAAPESVEVLIAIDFDDLGGLQAYLDHPVHAELGERFRRACADAMIFDFAGTRDASAIRALLDAE